MEACTLLPDFEKHGKFSSKVRFIFYLTTPYRGPYNPEPLPKVLRFSSHPRSNVDDIKPNFATIQNFLRGFQGLELFSFYGTLPMNVGVHRTIMVLRSSATLGYPESKEKYVSRCQSQAGLQARNPKVLISHVDSARPVQESVGVSISSLILDISEVTGWPQDESSKPSMFPVE